MQKQQPKRPTCRAQNAVSWTFFVRLLSIFLMTNGSGMQWSYGELVTEYQPNAGNCLGILPQTGQRDTTRQQLTGKKGCDTKEWIFRSKSNLLVKLPRLKDLHGGNMGHLYTKGKKGAWKLLLHAKRKKNPWRTKRAWTSEYCQKSDRVWGNWPTAAVPSSLDFCFQFDFRLIWARPNIFIPFLVYLNFLWSSSARSGFLLVFVLTAGSHFPHQQLKASRQIHCMCLSPGWTPQSQHGHVLEQKLGNHQISSLW